MKTPQPDFFRVTICDRLRFAYWEWQTFRLRDLGQREAACDNLWRAWVGRFGTVPPSARLQLWHSRRFSP